MPFQIETPPLQVQPAVCAMTGIIEDEYFVRIFMGDALWGSIVLSKTAIEEIGKAVNLVRKSKRVETLERIKADQDAMGPSIAMLIDKLAALGPVTDLLQTLDTHVESLNRLTESVSAELTKPTESIESESATASKSTTKP